MTVALATEFAPAARVTPEHLQEQARRLKDYPLLQAVIDGFPQPVVTLNECRQIVLANGFILQVLGKTDQESLLGLRPGEALQCINAKIYYGGSGTSEFCRACGAVDAILTSLEGAQAAGNGISGCLPRP